MVDRIDLAALAAALGRAFRHAGLPVTPERSARLVRALSLSPPQTRAELYWAARTVFVSAPEQVAAFDRVFATVFEGVADPGAARGDRNPPGVRSPEPVRLGTRSQVGSAEVPPGGPAPPGTELRDPRDSGLRPDAATELQLAAASSAERLADRDFAELEPDELRELRQLMRSLMVAPPLRRLRRLRRHPHGARLDVRATLRASCRTGGDPARRIHRRRLERPRRLVLLCDISGSMEPYARAYLQLLHAAVGAAEAEAFVFATRLTRVTRALHGRDADLALEGASATVKDWSSGTLLGESLRRFNDEHGRRGMARGAVVLIISDGWERGDPALVAQEMERLRRLAYRVVWVNPRKAAAGYAPLAGGMAAALPFCDEFVSGHTMQALAEVVGALRGGTS